MTAAVQMTFGDLLAERTIWTRRKKRYMNLADFIACLDVDACRAVARRARDHYRFRELFNERFPSP